MNDDFWQDRFHYCALAAGFIAASEGQLDDALYVRELAYCSSRKARSKTVAAPSRRTDFAAVDRGALSGTPAQRPRGGNARAVTSSSSRCRVASSMSR